MNKSELHARAALAVLEKYLTPDEAPVLPGNYHRLLAVKLTGLLTELLQGDTIDLDRRATMGEVAAVCGWDLPAILLLRGPGVKWPPPARVPPEIAHDATRCGRLRVALTALAGTEPEAPSVAEAEKIADKADSKTDNEKYLLLSEVCRIFGMKPKAVKGFCAEHNIPTRPEARRFHVALVPFAVAFARSTSNYAADAAKKRIAREIQKHELTSRLDAATAQFLGVE